MGWRPVCVAVVVIDFPGSTARQQNPHQVKTKLNKTGTSRKRFDFLNAGHHLGNAKKDADSRRQQGKSPDKLKCSFVVRHLTAAMG